MKKQVPTRVKMKSSVARANGRVAGAGFARLTGPRLSPAAIERQEHQIEAINAGFRNARLRDIECAELSCDDDFLSSLGF